MGHTDACCIDSLC